MSRPVRARDERGSVRIDTLGCKVNRVESESIAAALWEAGVRVALDRTGGGEDTAVSVVNTCCVTAEAERKSRKAIRRALSATSGPVLVTGCLVAVRPDAVAAIDRRVVVEPGKDLIAGAVAAGVDEEDTVATSDRDRRRSPMRAAAYPPARGRVGDGFRTRVGLKVQDGCDARCAYCVVPDARGPARSVPLAEIEADLYDLARSGVPEVVLTGIDIGRFEDGGRGLEALIEAADRSGIPRVRLSSIEPPDVTDELLEALAAARTICPHLHLPVQSGSDAVLARMGRRYDTAHFAALAESVRDALPGVALTTDVMAGFPGETEEEAEETLRFAERVGFDRLHVFRYSRRPGTPAADMSEQVGKREAEARARRLRGLDGRLRAAHRERRLGGRAEVLVERVEADGGASGTTEDYLAAVVSYSGVSEGDVLEVSLKGIDESGRMLAG